MKKTAICILVAVMLLLSGAVMGAPSASAQAPGDSAVTVSGRGEFADLKVTVDETEDLINQSVTVSWSGGKQTVVDATHKGNFLQVMQCWGDDLENGPDRTQCQFGAIIGESPVGGTWVRSRQVDTGLTDPKETLKRDPANPVDLAFVPFFAAGQEPPTGKAPDGQSEFYDSQITNEVPVARTRGDGTGELEFEVQTVREAAGLGCGEPVDVNGVTKGRSCWLVVVPRGVTEVDGTKVVDEATSSGGGLQTSPLSQTNWENRIAIPLEFRPVARACPLGAPERRLIGHELVVEAVSSWQPELCKGGGALYGFTQLSDDLSRSQLLEAADPGLTLMSRPVPPDQAPPNHPLVYAPVATSGLTFAFNVTKQPFISGPDDPQNAVLGVPFTEMKLTPRLVAKLLTQSYLSAISSRGREVPEGPAGPGQPARLEKNHIGLTVDPEFLDLNPEYKDLQPNPERLDALVQLGTSDMTALLWDWVLADPKAKAFVSGVPDESGMVVNEFNKGIEPPLDVYPRNDQTCGAPLGIAAPFPISNCNGDEHQFANDMHEAGRAAGRGDPLGREAGYDSSTMLKKLDRKPRQSIIERSLIAVVDAATADRYGLRTAKLLNAAGEFVAPDEAGLRAGLDAMRPSAVPGVLQPDPATTNAAAYPLTSLSYAATSPSALTEVAGREYAAFLRYAAGPGQQPGILPGQLPFGYLPLPEPLRAQTLAAATTIETQAGRAFGGDPAEEPPAGTGSPTGTTAPGSVGVTGTGIGAQATSGTGAAGTAPAGASPPGSDSAANAPGAPAALPGTATEPVADVRRTPALPAPAVGALLVALLIGGGLAAALAPVTHLLGTQRPSGGGDVVDRTVTKRYFSWSTARSAFFARRR